MYHRIGLTSRRAERKCLTEVARNARLATQTALPESANESKQDTQDMNTKASRYLILYGGFLIATGVAGYLSNPEKAKTALKSGGLFGALSILWGVLSACGVRWSLPAAITTTGLLALVFLWRASVGWLAVLDGKSEKLVAPVLITAMLAASAAMLPALFRCLKTRSTPAPPTGSQE